MTAPARLVLGVTADSRFGTNSYLVEDEATRDAVVIDANLEPEDMVELVAGRGCRVVAILLTHTDVDHVAGLQRLLEAFGPVPVAVHDAERYVLEEGRQLRREMPIELPRVEAGIERLDPASAYRAGSLEFEVRHTPGHSPGGVSLLIGDAVFTGDALFAGSIGRSDFANSDGRALLDGIREQLLTLPGEVQVFPGHGPATTIAQEIRTNPFL